MSAARTAALGTAAALAVGVGVVAASLSNDGGDLTGNPPPRGVTDKQVGPAHALDDGTGLVVYVADFRLDDGGVETRKAPAPDCVRRPAKTASALCQRRMTLIDGKVQVVDPGNLNRFPASEAVGVGCQPVACAVFAGEDADGEEATIVKQLGGVLRARAKP